MHSKILKMDNIPEKLLSLGERKCFKKNEIILYPGEKLNYMYILVEGKVLVLTNSLNGLLIYDFLLLPNCIIAEMCVNDKIECPSTFKCLEDSEIILISKDTIKNILKSDYDIASYLHNVTTNLFFRFFHQANEYATSSTEERITNILIEFAEEFGENNDGEIKINFNLSQQFISNLVGVKRITTARIIKKLKDENSIKLYESYYYIKDINKLKKYSSIL